MKEFREIVIDKVNYKKEKFFVLNKNLNRRINNLKFGKLVKIFHQNDNYILICLKYSIERVDEKRLLYFLKSDDDLVILDLENDNNYHISLVVIEKNDDTILIRNF